MLLGMTILKRYRVTWAGTPVVGPGLSTFYESPESGVGGADAIEAFFAAIASYVPLGMSWTIPSNGDLITAETGVLTGSWSDPGTGGVVTSSGASSYVNGTGMRVVWNTDGIFKGRRVKGSTFIVPVASTGFEGPGNIIPAVLTGAQAAANALVGSLDNMAIWSRPSDGTPGQANQVISAAVPDFVSWLRSRRT